MVCDERRRVILFEVNWPDAAGHGPGTWLPYSIASTWAQILGNDHLTSAYVLDALCSTRASASDRVLNAERVDVLGFSTGAWNEQFNLATARDAKSRWPSALVVFGGPQVPRSVPMIEAYLRQHPQIDLVVTAEGEVVFSEILSRGLSAMPDFVGIAGCYGRHLFERGMTAEALTLRTFAELDSIRSPYEAGVLDGLVRNGPRSELCAVLETTRGCPFGCVFCDWGLLTRTTPRFFAIDRVLADIDWLAANGVGYVMLSDANFGMFPAHDAEVAAALIRAAERHGAPRLVAANFTPQPSSETLAIARDLHRAGLLKGFTISLQSTSRRVLRTIRRPVLSRGRQLATLASARELKVPTYTEFILGLPGETLRSWKKGLFGLLEVCQHDDIEVYMLSVLPNAPLADPDYVEAFGIQVEHFAQYRNTFAETRDASSSEVVSLAFATDSMSHDDYRSAAELSAMVINLHSFGWLQAIARWARACGMRYRTFYNRVQYWMEDHPESRLGRAIAAVGEHLDLMRMQTQYAVTARIDGIDVGSAPLLQRPQIYLHANRERVFEEIDEMVRSRFADVISRPSLRDDLLAFQRSFVVSHELRYPAFATFRNDWPSLLAGGACDGPATYLVEARHPWLDWPHFVEQLYYRRKQGFSKTRMTRMPPKQGTG